ncbi:MAG: DNA-binding protein [Methylococcaceae bacterium]|uniref:DNA-binding protein n=1 Tax=Methylicorpusculum sp. TaxID=2713644 RepID=UPI002743B839|nr:DNA-binding protein [Methylicorpusculum sp.]MDP2393258.1 DNA-binding protein [Methylococcaceae bacterium]MDZ4218867.1 DNA-binding protein [Methylobacter sp.]MDP3392048.1 DNA-binding protein [Methylococcaceae bacterium]MDP3931769.1 DNA-binding protein [Methylococcaceae bacterium]MDZ4153769.1 DNA-binding protein [Methylicorpusculum sp.]
MQTTTIQTGRPAEFAPEAIIQAGQELRDAGRNITGFALRQKVGGGNPSRLKQVWDEYLSSQSVTRAEPVAELPIEVAEEVAIVTKTLTERLSMLAVELNDKAVKAAERRVAEVVRAAGDQREQAERELADASSTVDDLEAKLNEVRAESEVFEKRLAETQAISQQQAVELAQLRERLALTEQTAKTANEQHAIEFERIRTELAEQKKSVQSLTAERDQGRADLATVKAQAAAAEETHQEQRKRTAEETHRVAERLTKIEADRDNAHKQAATAREEAAQLRGQLEATKAQAAELIQALSSHQPAKTTGAKKTTPS